MIRQLHGQRADEKIANSKNGVVTAKATGTTKITATVGTHKAECTVTVNAKLTGIKVTPDKVTVEKGQKANLNVTYLPADTTDEKAVHGRAKMRALAQLMKMVLLQQLQAKNKKLSQQQKQTIRSQQYVK